MKKVHLLRRDIKIANGDDDDDDNDDDADADIADDNSASDEDDDIKEDTYRDPPVNHLRLRPSLFKNIPSTIFMEYPPDQKIKRKDVSVIEPLGKRKVYYKSYWERICIRNAFRRAGFNKLDDDNAKHSKYWTAMWSKHQNDSQMKELNCLQKINHFPDSWCVGRKDRLHRTLNSMKRVRGSEFDFHPDGYILPGERENLYRRILNDLEHAKMASHSNDTSNVSMWIMKPVASSCGRGIKVLTGSQVLKLPTHKSIGIFQKYLHDPYLIDGKKFDLRIYVLVTGFDPCRIYVHKEGLTRISTSTYSLKNIKNRFAHLTNYSVNKKSSKFKAASMPKVTLPEDSNGDATTASPIIDIEGEREGYKWSLAAFRRWLAEEESHEIMLETFKKIHDLCVKTMIAAESEITPSLHSKANYRTNCFELFGCDVILDSKLTPHLLEVNVSPSLTGSSPLDKKIKGMLLADLYHIVGLYPHDKSILTKYQANGVSNFAPSASASSDKVNPFAFSSLSAMMIEQDAWRKQPVPASISLKGLGNNESAWLILLMAEDEFQRAHSTEFQRLHPTKESCQHYSSLYHSNRFTDHLLAKWVMEGMSTGPCRQLIPSTFIDKRPVSAVAASTKKMIVSDGNSSSSSNSIMTDIPPSPANSNGSTSIITSSPPVPPIAIPNASSARPTALGSKVQSRQLTYLYESQSPSHKKILLGNSDEGADVLSSRSNRGKAKPAGEGVKKKKVVTVLKLQHTLKHASLLPLLPGSITQQQGVDSARSGSQGHLTQSFRNLRL